jgi:hypothetical protein
MTNQEVVTLGVAGVILVTNCLGAAFTMRRVYAKWVEQTATSGHVEPSHHREELLAYCAQTVEGRNRFERVFIRFFFTGLVWLVMAVEHFIPFSRPESRSSKRIERE